MNAVLYIRVSTVDQAIRGDEPEGFSIPAQREACKRKAKSIKATIIDEYVDRGESARSADRPELQRMLRDLAKRKDIDFIIVHKVDRLARSLHDDVMIGLAIQKAGAQLVSVTENIDDTPSGRLLHGIMATIAEFYSRNLAAEALKGATQKAKRGGTPYRAPLGYINAIRHINEREARTVVLDAERAPFITWAFEQYATGDYTIKQLSIALNKRGLRNRRHGKSTGILVSRSAVAKILNNRYYAGYVKYMGIEYKGRHKPLVRPAVFAAVQAVLKSHNRAGSSKSSKHHHYLQGTIFCGQCGRRLSYAIAKSRYEYFYCLSRGQGQQCNQPYIPLEVIEDVVAKQLVRVQLSPTDRSELQREVRSQLRGEIAESRTEVARQEKRLSRLLMEQQRILQAYYEKVIGVDLLGGERKRLDAEIDEAKSIVAESVAADTAARRNQRAILQLVDDLNLETAYRSARPLLRRYLNQALFARVLINDNRQIDAKPGEHDVTVVAIEFPEKIQQQRLAQAVIGLTFDSTGL